METTHRRLSDRDWLIFDALNAAAEASLPCPTTDELMEVMECESNSTPIEAVRRLEQAGLIRVRRGQQHRVVTICRTGRSTSEPPNMRPHWRERPLGRAAAALALVEGVKPGSAAAIRALSEESGTAVPSLVGELMIEGLRSIQRKAARKVGG